MAAESRISAGVELIPGYDLVSKLGEGGFGAVWQANGPGNIPIALKLIQLGDSDAGFREFKSLDLLRELRHPNLLPIHAYWLLDDEGKLIDDSDRADMLVIAMLLAEQSLRDVLRSYRKKGAPGIPTGDLLEYIRDAARGLDFLNSPTHKLGDDVVSIQHRDIKPENLLVVGGGVMVADFGIAKVLAPGARSSYTEHVSLTLAYGAPELFEGRATSRTDQYSLALTYYELLTGQLPFDKDVTPATVVNVHMKGKHDFSRIGEADQSILRKATSPDPDDRYATCLDLVNALSAVHRDGGVAVTGDFSDQQLMSTQVSKRQATKPLDDRTTHDSQSIPSRTDVGYQTVNQFPTQTAEVAKRSLGTIAIIAWIAVAGAAGGWWFATRQSDVPPADANASTNKQSVVASETTEPSAAEAELPADSGSAIEDESGSMAPSIAPVRVPTPSLREQAATALLAKEYEKALAAYDTLVENNQATSEDFAARATAHSGLAESSADPACNFVLAASDWLKAGEGSRAASAHYAAAGAYGKLAEQQYESDAKDSEVVQKLDKQFEQQLRQAIDLAAELSLDTQATWEAELDARPKLPRIANRIAMSTARDAIPEVARQLAEDPNNVNLLLRAARLEETLGITKDAATHFARGYSLLAIERARAGELEAAKQAGADALEHDPNQQIALTNFAIGVLANAEQDDSRALRALTAAIELAGEADPVWEMLRERAQVHVRNGKSNSAVLDLEKAIEVYPAAVSAPLGTSVSLDQRNISRLHASIGALLESQAGQEVDPKALGAALEAFRQAAKYDPTTLSYQLGAARILVRLSEHDSNAEDVPAKLSEAASVIGKILARDDTFAEPHYLAGRVNLLKKNAATAQQAFDRAIANIDEERDRELLYPIYSNQATAYLLDPRDDSAALAAAGNAIAIDKAGIVGQFCRAMALRNLKKVPEAISGFEVVLSIDPDHAASLLAKAQLIVEKSGSTDQQLAAARRDIERGLALAKTDSLKAEGHYVDSLAWLKVHIDGKANADVGEPALLKCQTAASNAIRLAPTNAVYRKAGEQVFGYAQRYDWQDETRRQQSTTLSEKYAKLK